MHQGITTNTKAHCDPKGLKILLDLQEALEGIELCVTEELIEKLLIAGRLAKSLPFNSKNKSFIRNKYGTVDHSQNDEGKKHQAFAIPFNHLAAFADIPSAQYTHLTDIAALLEDLQAIQSQINIAIQIETTSEVYKLEKLKTLHEPKYLITFINTAYTLVLCTTIKSALSDLSAQNLDLQLPHDRYYFGNALLIIGELCREVQEFINFYDTSILSIFKKIRNRYLVHNLRALESPPSRESLSQYAEVFTILQSSLLGFIDSTHSYLTSLFSKESSTHWTEYEHSKILPKKIEDPDALVIVNAVLQNIFTDSYYPVENIDVNELFSKKQNKFLLTRKLAVHPNGKKQIAFLNILKSLEYIINPNNQFRSYKSLKQLNPFIQRYNAFATKLGVSLINTTLSVESSGYITELKNHLTTPIFPVDIRLNELRVAVQDRNHAYGVRTSKDVVYDCVETAADQIHYIESVIHDDDIEPEKKSYIIRFALSKVGQAYRDFNDRQSCVPEFNALMQKLPLCNESMLRTIQMRNKGIAHEVQSFDAQKLFDTVVNSAIPLKNDLYAMHYLLGYANSEMIEAIRTRDIKIIAGKAMHIASCHQRLAQYNEAEQTLSSGLKEIDALSAINPEKEQIYYEYKAFLLHDRLSLFNTNEKIQRNHHAILDLIQKIVAIIENRLHKPLPPAVTLNLAYFYAKLNNIQQSQILLNKYLTSDNTDPKVPIAKVQLARNLISQEDLISLTTAKKVLDSIEFESISSRVVQFDILYNYSILHTLMKNFELADRCYVEASQLLSTYDGYFRKNYGTHVFFQKKAELLNMTFFNSAHFMQQSKLTISLDDLITHLDDACSLKKAAQELDIEISEDIITKFGKAAQDYLDYYTKILKILSRSEMQSYIKLLTLIIELESLYKFPIPLGEVYYNLAYAYRETNKPDIEIIKLLENAIKIKNRQPNISDELLSNCNMFLGDIYALQKNYPIAAVYFIRARFSQGIEKAKSSIKNIFYKTPPHSVDKVASLKIENSKYLKSKDGMGVLQCQEPLTDGQLSPLGLRRTVIKEFSHTTIDQLSRMKDVTIEPPNSKSLSVSYIKKTDTVLDILKLCKKERQEQPIIARP